MSKAKRLLGLTEASGGDEVEKAFLKAIEDLKTMEWGSDEQIKSENLAFDLAKKNGWDADNDDEFQEFALKATNDEILAKGLECYRKAKDDDFEGGNETLSANGLL